jgi:Periplasmic binding protein
MNHNEIEFAVPESSQVLRCWRGVAQVGCSILLVVVLAAVGAATAEGAHTGVGTSVKQTLLDGERMYRTGILPSGKPMPVAMEGGVSLPGMTFACASCHTRSGLGTMEEGRWILPINGKNLFRPLYRYFPGLSPSEREELPLRFRTRELRPAYTEATLSTAIRKGVDPNGRVFSPVMPKYTLSNHDMTTLIDYLKELSSQPSPGSTETNIALATVITDDVAQADRDAMLESLDGSVRGHNLLGDSPGDMRRMLSMGIMFLNFRRWTLAHWVLTGPPNTWRSQLEDFYRAQPVFALVGGFSNDSWKPIHQFCEDHQIPCILPITDLPQISPTDYYTVYFTKGYYQEGEAVARYLTKTLDSKRPWNLVQILGSGPAATALAAGFQSAWDSDGGKAVQTINLEVGQPLTTESLLRLVPKGRDTVLMVWTGPDSYGAMSSLAASRNRPALVFLSSTLLGGRLWDLPLEARPFTYFSYPYREPGPRTLAPKMAGQRPTVVNKEYRANDRRIASKTGTVVALLADALMRMEQNFYRDHLLDQIDMTQAQEQTDYELLNFGPGQRYLSESCYIMRLSEGPNPMLIRMNDSD